MLCRATVERSQSYDVLVEVPDGTNPVDESIAEAALTFVEYEAEEENWSSSDLSVLSVSQVSAEEIEVEEYDSEAIHLSMVIKDGKLVVEE